MKNSLYKIIGSTSFFTSDSERYDTELEAVTAQIALDYAERWGNRKSNILPTMPASLFTRWLVVNQELVQDMLNEFKMEESRTKEKSE